MIAMARSGSYEALRKEGLVVSQWIQGRIYKAAPDPESEVPVSDPSSCCLVVVSVPDVLQREPRLSRGREQGFAS